MEQLSSLKETSKSQHSKESPYIWPLSPKHGPKWYLLISYKLHFFWQIFWKNTLRIWINSLFLYIRAICSLLVWYYVFFHFFFIFVPYMTIRGGGPRPPIWCWVLEVSFKWYWYFSQKFLGGKIEQMWATQPILPKKQQKNNKCWKMMIFDHFENFRFLKIFDPQMQIFKNSPRVAEISAAPKNA